MPQIIPLFPKEISTFIDLFGGGFNVGVNVDATKIIYNDLIKQVVELFGNFSTRSSGDIHLAIIRVIQDYGLSRSDLNSYEFYGCNSNNGLGEYNKEKYYKLRSDYNASPTWDKFYTLIAYAFSSQIRFNSKCKFNMPCGKRDYNISLQTKLKIFVDRLKNIDVSFECKDFRKINLTGLTSQALVYCDPPYFNSTATYNENGGWTFQDENDLLHILKQIDSNDVKFALSNNFTTNPGLERWANDNGYTIHYLNSNYSNCNYQKKDKHTKDIEVLITNY